MKRLLGSFAVLSLLFCLSGCGGSSDDESFDSSQAENTDTARSAQACADIGLPTRVIGGTSCGALGASPVVRVLTIHEDGTESYCTGTMIAPNIVVTAFHCYLLSASPIVATGIAAGEITGPIIVPGNPLFHPGIRVENIGPETILFNDIALIVLAEPLAIPTVPVLTSYVPGAGELANVYGYGLSTEPVPGVPTAIDISELRSGNVSIQSATNNHFRTIRQGGAGTCFGDSGGPLIYMFNGEPTLIGVISQFPVPSTCGEGSHTMYTRIQSTEIINLFTGVIPNLQLR